MGLTRPPNCSPDASGTDAAGPTMPELSFVVPAYNEEAVIGPTLNAIHGAARAVGVAYEIIVADDASTDRTAEIAASLGASVVAVSNRQIAATRNAGARASRGRWLFFVDADTLMNESALRAVLGALRAGAAGGGCAIRFGGWIPWHARVLLPPLVFLYGLARLASGACIYCTREVFDDSGGFPEAYFAGEEIFMSIAIRRRGRFVFVRRPVTTSGRKLRTFGARELYGTLFKLSLRGLRGVRSREGLDIWYGERRADDTAKRS